LAAQARLQGLYRLGLTIGRRGCDSLVGYTEERVRRSLRLMERDVIAFEARKAKGKVLASAGQ
jgi:hypothetical protein